LDERRAPKSRRGERKQKKKESSAWGKGDRGDRRFWLLRGNQESEGKRKKEKGVRENVYGGDEPGRAAPLDGGGSQQPQ